MKHDRLYALTLYRSTTEGLRRANLAERFEVSIRTIQRDIDALGRAGIPGGIAAGKMRRLCAGRGLSHGAPAADAGGSRESARGDGRLASATGDPSAGAGLEKLMAVSPEADSDVVLDFSVLRERDQAALALVRRRSRSIAPCALPIRARGASGESTRSNRSRRCIAGMRGTCWPIRRARRTTGCTSSRGWRISNWRTTRRTGIPRRGKCSLGCRTIPAVRGDRAALRRRLARPRAGISECGHPRRAARRRREDALCCAGGGALLAGHGARARQRRRN